MIPNTILNLLIGEALSEASEPHVSDPFGFWFFWGMWGLGFRFPCFAGILCGRISFCCSQHVNQFRPFFYRIRLRLNALYCQTGNQPIPFDWDWNRNCGCRCRCVVCLHNRISGTSHPLDKSIDLSFQIGTLDFDLLYLISRRFGLIRRCWTRLKGKTNRQKRIAFCPRDTAPLSIF